MSEYIEVGQSLQFTDPNTPTRVGELVDTRAKIFDIPNARLGLQVWVIDEKKNYIITELEGDIINGERVDNVRVKEYKEFDAIALQSLIDVLNGSGKGSIDKKIEDAIKSLIAGAPESFDTLKEIADWITNDKTGAAAMADKIQYNSKAIADEKNRAEGVENDIKNKATHYGTLGFSTYADRVNFYGKSVDGSNTISRNIPAATTENAGVMTASDKNKLENVGLLESKLLNGTIIVQLAEIAKAVESGAITLDMLDETLQNANTIVNSLDTLYGGRPLSAYQGTILKNLIDDITKTGGTIDTRIATAIRNVINNAPENFDTLKEIADWIAANGDVSQLVASIQKNANDISAEAQRAKDAENAIDKKVTDEVSRATNRENKLAEQINNIEGVKSVTITPSATDVTLKVNEKEAALPAATTEAAGVMSAEDKITLSSVDLNTYITNTLDSDNLINFEKPLYEGYYVASGGVLSANSNYNVYLVPMNGKYITINVGGNFFLAATDKAGKITHVNSENANNNKVIEYLEGDVYALVSVPKSNNNTFVVRYVDTYIEGYTRYNTPVGVNELEKLEEKCIDVYNVIKSSYNSKELLPAIAFDGKNITVSSTSNNVNIVNNSYNNCYSYKVSFVDKRDYVIINTKTAISSIIGFNSSTSPTASPISAYKNIIGEVTLIITPDELGSNTHIWFACDKNVTPNVELFSFSQDEIVISNNSIEPKATTFFNRNLFNIDDTDVIVGKYLTKSGSIATNATYIISGFIPFNREMGKLLAARSGNPNVYMGGAYCYYNANKEYIKGYNYSEKRIAEWEEGVAYVRFSLYNEYGQIIVVGDSVFPYMEYGDEKVNNRYISNQYCGVDAITEIIGSIDDGVTYELTKFPYYIKKNVGVSLSADLATMGTVIVGKGYNKYLGMWVEVDSTNVKVYKYVSSASNIHTAEHGLDINTFVKINLFLNNEGSLQIIIFSKGGCYKTSVEDCGYEMNYAPFVLCSGASLSNVKLGASCADIRLPVWVFGDSYLGVTDNRWPGIIKDFGFFNVMFDGLAGITSTGIYAEVRKLLSMSIPKYIVWCLGMNDSTDDYKRIFDLVKQLCANIGVTMIATTIPTVPTRSKEDITNYVKSSGVRYIDMYSAVGATSTGTWHEGMLSSDGVHPTQLGAQAMAMQVLTDFPEIMQY